MKTNAIVLSKIGSASHAFSNQEIPLPALKHDEVLIDSEAFGLNYADVMARRGLYKEAPPLPCVIGYELVGKIIEVGNKEDQHLIGQRVLAFSRFGAYAKLVITKLNAIIPLPNAKAEIAMALSTQAVTAYYMSDYISTIRRNDIVLIHAAAGGVGSLLIQLSKLAGAIVIAKVSSDEKEELAKRLGADFTVNYTKKPYEVEIESILKGRRLDISFNAVGGASVKKDMRLLGSGGRLFLFGGAELLKGRWGIFSKLSFLRKMGIILPVALMMRSKSILGVNMLKIADNKPHVIEACMKEVMALFESGKLVPQVGKIYHVADISAAHNYLESGKSTGKITVFWN
jgi:NADPH2:quinone reductase